MMICTCEVSDTKKLWETYREAMSEDFLHQKRQQLENPRLPYDDDVFNKALIAIEDMTYSMSGHPVAHYGLPTPQRSDEALRTELIRETTYNMEELQTYVNENEPKLLEDQRTAYEAIINSVTNSSGTFFFLDAPGGTGKTFVLNLALATVRRQKKIALAVASSGIAATLLTGGRTAHSTFKLPLDLNSIQTPTCNVSRESGPGQLMQRCSLIIWDECTMSHKKAFEAVDRSLKDLRHNDKNFGGVTVIVAGDFRQTLPVVPRGTKADELQACLKASYLWTQTKRLQLKTNMRARIFGYQQSGEFANNLQLLGDGKVTHAPDGKISLDPIANSVMSAADLKEKVFANLEVNYKNLAWLAERAILAPRNADVDELNHQLIQQLPGTAKTYKSVDTVVNDDDTVLFPTEFLNSLNPPGTPPHILSLKEGTPIMLLRNLDPPKLCNGTRLAVKQMLRNIIEATILTGAYKGENVFIPRIPVKPTELVVEMKRLQFPIKISFAMTINKSQGQSLKAVGIDLSNDCFSHGQLYVGCSRVGTKTNLFVMAPNNRTINVVYPESLQQRIL